jgi:hypothetical protein
MTTSAADLMTIDFSWDIWRKKIENGIMKPKKIKNFELGK